MADHRETLRRIAAREPLRAWSADTTDLPWGDPEFSERMLREHLDQSHELASRRLDTIERQTERLIEWLGIGPGSSLLDVTVASTPGAGSVFTIHLPRVAGTAEVGAPAVRSRPTLGGSETILVAEDEQAVRVFIERVLSRAGYGVLAAANGPEALALASTLPRLDLLFTDMVMPGMSGRELAAQLAATHPTARTVYASGYSNDALLYGVGTDGKSPYLAKPFTADGLLTKVREVLDSPD